MLEVDRQDLVGEKVYRFVKEIRSETGGLNRVVRTANLPPHGEASLAAQGGSVDAEIYCRQMPDGGVLVFAVDLTERRRSELAALESEKKRWQSMRIEALGRLAGGIAHDFNNFLAVLLLHADILDLHLKDNEPARDRVKEIKAVSNSVAQTVRQLFAFGRKQPMTLAPVKPDELLRSFADEFSQSHPEVAVKLEIDSDLGLCFVDQTQIRNVLRNLSSNAMESLPASGTITISARNVVLDATSAPKVQPAGSYIEIAVSDSGPGMAPDAEDYIFEPFFSPKGSDKGAGLALAMVYGIVKQSKGFIWAESDPDTGTTFRIQFPRIDVTEVGETEPASTAETGPKTVLLVDDEPSVRRITAEFLKMADLEVLEAGSGMEAIEIAQEHQGPIHLLLTDFSMPLMDGRQVANKITRLRPETAVLYMSGNIEHVVVEEMSPAEPVNFIYKPFSSSSLTEKVRQVLGMKSDH